MQAGYTDELRELPARYWSTGDLPDFMEQASPFIMRYCRRRLSRDDDLIGDFYVHFYERAPGCLEHYKSRQDIPFTGYLATYLRHEFLNYAKTSRNARYSETPTAEFFGRERSMFSFSGADEEPDAPELPPEDSVDQLLEPLPLHVRLPIKLYHGLELNFEELHEIAGVHETPIAAAQFMTGYRTRRLRLSERVRKLEDRSAHLTYLIHRQPGTDAHQRWSRWKTRLSNMLVLNRGVMSIGELSQLLGVSKSTISRRMEQGRRYIRGEQES